MSRNIGPIEEFMAAEHARLDRLLGDSESPDGLVREPVYAQFRHDMLRHIGMEEKILLPFARAQRSGEPLEAAARLRRDHSEIARLLVAPPSPSGLAALRDVLRRHNPLEEGASGLYATCDALAGAGSADVVERLRAQPQVPLAPYYGGPPHRAR